MSDTTSETVVEDQPAVSATPEGDPAPSLTPYQEFLEMLPDDIKENPSLADFKGDTIGDVVGKLAKSFIHTKKLVGADKSKLLKYPSSDSPKEDWDDFYSKIGRPDDVDGYGLSDLTKELSFDESALKAVAEAAHANGVSKDAFSQIIKAYSGYVQSAMDVQEKEYEAMQEKYTADLKGRWGAAYEQKTNNLMRVLKEKASPEFLEMAKENPKIFDNPVFIETIDNLVKMSAEDGGPNSGSSGSGDVAMTPTEARAAIAAMDSDKDKMKILMDRDSPQREFLLKERERLFKFAYGV